MLGCIEDVGEFLVGGRGEDKVIDIRNGLVCEEALAWYLGQDRTVGVLKDLQGILKGSKSTQKYPGPKSSAGYGDGQPIGKEGREPFAHATPPCQLPKVRKQSRQPCHLAALH